MLPRPSRLTRGVELRAVVRNGSRGHAVTLVAHLLLHEPGSAARLTRAGFIVSSSVGGSVIRSRVSRRLRHLVVDRLPALPPGSDLVVRALPAAADASSGQLGADLDAALGKARAKAQGKAPAGPGVTARQDQA